MENRAILTVVVALAAAAPLFLAAAAHADLRTETVEYRHGDVVCEGYLVWDAAIEGTRPGVIVVHAWRGLGDYERMRAGQLARLGYVAFAIDMYGKGVRAADNKEASALAGTYRKDRPLMRARAKAGLDRLKAHPLCDATRTGAIGYCFGGQVVLELARSGADVSGVASFHGGLDTPDPALARNIKGKVLVCHGAADRAVSGEVLLGFIKEMNDARVDWQLKMYGNAVHSFTTPSAGNDPATNNAYDEKADRRSWADMKAFFEETLGK